MGFKSLSVTRNYDQLIHKIISVLLYQSCIISFEDLSLKINYCDSPSIVIDL